MKILFDTNVLVSALITSGNCYDVIKHSIHEHEIYCTSSILSEFENVFKNKFQFQETVVDEFKSFINEFFIMGQTADFAVNICRDDADNHVLADAVMNKVHVIITGDSDLLDLKTYRGIRIISPKDYWSELT